MLGDSNTEVSGPKRVLKVDRPALWIEWLDKQSDVDKRTITLQLAERLMELGEVEFRAPPDDADEDEECLFWDSNGEDLRIPF